VAASIHRRLLDLAHERQRPFNELLQYYAIERFLFRLGQSSHRQHFILKGALLLRTWDPLTSRPTMDIDLLGFGDNAIEALVRVVQECMLVDVADDGVRFDPASVRGESITRDAEYLGVRVLFEGTLGERTRLHLQVDVGLGDAVVPAPIGIEYPVLLDQAHPLLLGYTAETVVAEKLHAMVELDLANSRMKDFWDIVNLARRQEFQLQALVDSVVATFSRRGTAIPGVPPTAFTEAFFDSPAKQIQWRAFLKKSRLPDTELRTTIVDLATFAMPVLTAAAAGEPKHATWSPATGWRQ